MNHVNLSMVKKRLTRGSWMANMKKIVVCSALLLPLGFFSGCSDDSDETGPSTFLYWVLEEDNQNMPSSGLIISQYSDSPAESDIRKIVDNDVNTNYVTPHSKFYIVWNGNKNIAVNYYTLTSASDASEKDPKSWTFYGSNDNNIWIPLDKQSDQAFSGRQEKKAYQFENGTAYKYYKLAIESNGGGTSTQIAEWTLEGNVPTNINDLMEFSSGDTYDASTPMGNHYANKHVTTEADRTWLKNAENEPSELTSNSSLHLTNFIVENLYPYGTPKPADVNQHGIGDCSALAIFASMAYMYPNFIKSIIQDNGNQTYTVAMFDPQGESIEVTVSSKFLADSNGNIGAASGKNNQITWATILEKAVMKWNYIYQVNPDIGGIGSEHVAPLFTGNGSSFAFAPGKLTPEQLARAVDVSLSQGKIVVGGFTTADVSVGSYRTVTGHAYTLMYSTDATALFSMRNPWGTSPGSSDGKEDGVLNISDDGVVPPIIDLRIIDPGKAADSGLSTLQPYVPPVF
ncbi:C2 family cysteine protease [uncultured Bacteroides sp.]|uniref:C2 family cysteine protease n=1 Tax=uncultured Bacteroides sp. TaxID=162156 RepID=UPI002AA8A1B4|nr:C2 family cysteine protease [uncultured Bacteroides sp.]